MNGREDIIKKLLRNAPAIESFIDLKKKLCLITELNERPHGDREVAKYVVFREVFSVMSEMILEIITSTNYLINYKLLIPI